MRVPSRGHTRSVNFNFTSLIDMVFLLNIFFIVASSLAREEASAPIALPEASQFAGDDSSSPSRITVTVLADGTLQVSGQDVTLAEVEQRIQAAVTGKKQTFEVRIRSDRAAEYSHVEPILIACARLGVPRVGFAVLPK